ncbi:hypothetical protein KC19_12G093900 [Ceratodon purpureus]|uniref:Uncharacterized protein n=1 Tax=Ceratodon purpureus TaxID=3225 RepID=A0A8T0G7X9_CERPU|nr:hypothetical protein KC19_12G093900 [Ceratodon purpureus]
MFQLQKLSLRIIYRPGCSFFRMNSGGMEDTSQIFLCKSGGRRRPASARDATLTNIDYHTQVLNMVDEIVQGSQRKGNRQTPILPTQKPPSVQHHPRSCWTTAAQAAHKEPSESITWRNTIRPLDGNNTRASAKLCNTTEEKCVCGRTPRAFLPSQRTPTTSPVKHREKWGHGVPNSFRNRDNDENSRQSTPSPMEESPRSESPVSHLHSRPPTRLHSARRLEPSCCSTPSHLPHRHGRPSSPPSYAALLAAIASASPLRTRLRSRPQSAPRRSPASRSCTPGSFAAAHELYCSSHRQSPPLSQRSFHSRSVHLQEASTTRRFDMEESVAPEPHQCFKRAPVLSSPFRFREGLTALSGM